MLYEYEFNFIPTLVERARCVSFVFGEGSTVETAASHCFKGSGRDTLKSRVTFRGKPFAKVNNKKLKVLLNFNPSQSARVLAHRFGVYENNIIVYGNK